MFITPMTSIRGIGSIDSLNGMQDQNNISNIGNQSFKNIFQDIMGNVTQAEESLAKSQYMLATGQIEDAHTVPIEAANAQLSIDLMVQLRNKALDAYSELMRINI